MTARRCPISTPSSRASARSITAYGTAVVRQFEMTGAYCLNSATAIGNSRDKLLAHQLMAMSGLPMPTTAFASSPHDTDDLIAMVGGPPLVVKLLHSSQGKGVVLAENKKSAQSVIDAFRNAEANFLVQQFVADAAGQDMRCIVLDGKVIATMRRQAPSDDFRANLHKGGSAHEVKITSEERKMAVEGGQGHGAEICRRRPAAVGEGAAAARSEFLARPRRHREDHRASTLPAR